MLVPERRELPSFTIGLTDEQVALKRKMMKEAKEQFPNSYEWFVELAADFCVRHPEEATHQRETDEWHKQPTAFSPAAMQKLSLEYAKDGGSSSRDLK